MDEKSLDRKYVDFIEDLILQTSNLLPKDVNKLQQNYLVQNMKKSCMTLTKSMQEEDTFQKLDFETQCLYIQIMAEWSFHKEIDLFRSGIPAKYWKGIMQKIWATMWDVMYACVENDASQSLLLDIVEKYVNTTYINAISELKYVNAIDEEIEEQAKEQSNISLMANDLKRHSQILENLKKYVFLFTIGIFIGIGVTFTVLKFKILGIISVLIAMIIFNVIVVINNRKTS